MAGGLVPDNSQNWPIRKVQCNQETKNVQCYQFEPTLTLKTGEVVQTTDTFQQVRPVSTQNHTPNLVNIPTETIYAKQAGTNDRQITTLDSTSKLPSHFTTISTEPYTRYAPAVTYDSYITHIQPEKQENESKINSELSSLLHRSIPNTTSVLPGSVGQQTTSPYLQTNNVAPDQPNTLNMQPSFKTKDQDNVIMAGEPIAKTFTTPVRQQNRTESQSLINKTGFTLPHNPYTKIEKNQNSEKQAIQQNYDCSDDFVHAVNQTCLYANGNIGHIKGRFLVDTGSSICVISDKAYNLLDNSDTTLTPTTEKVRMADGNLLKLKGICDLEIQLDHLKFKQEFLVADIDESLEILGINFLEKYEADVKIKKRQLKTNLGKIKLHQNSSDSCYRIQLYRNVTIPAHSETYVKTYSTQNTSTSLNILEPAKCYIDKGLIIARTLIDTSQDQMTISLLNCSNKNVKLRQNTTLGIAHPVDQVLLYEDRCTDKIELGDRDCPSVRDAVCMKNQESVKDSSKNQIIKQPEQFPASNELSEYLEPLIQNASSDLSPSERDRLTGLVTEFKDIFMSPDGKLKQTDLAEHYIDTGDTKPFKLPCRRLPMFKKPIVQNEIEKMLEQEVIEPSVSEWNSPICLVTKKSGEWRFCVDLRALNSVTRLDTYPLPRIDETLDHLSNSKYFSTLDMASGYWQISLNSKDRDKTSFAIPGLGTWRFKVMCFGLKNAPSSFSRLMEVVLKGLQFEKCLVYLDDIIVVGKDFETALENLRLVFSRLRQAKLQLKVSKCLLLQKSVLFLGHQVSEFGITCDLTKSEIIRDWPQPQDKTEIKSFLGLANYYRKMVPNFSDIASPLTRLTKKKAKFAWGQLQEEAFVKLKQCLTEPPILAFPLEQGGSFVLDCDASGFAIGAVLSQYQSNAERVIAYGSHTLNEAQQNYCTTKRELYSIVYFVQHFKHYLLGRKFILRTDHASLQWLCNFKEPSGILARWLSILGAYDYKIIFRPGHMHANADAVSRKPKRPCLFPECRDCNPKVVSDKSSGNAKVLPCSNLTEQESSPLPNWLKAWTQKELAEMQRNDPCILEVINLKEQFQQRPTKSKIGQIHRDIITLLGQWELLKINEGLLYREIEDEMGSVIMQLVAPREMKNIIFTHLHEQRYSAHLGRDRTITAIKKRFYWPGMNDEIARWCKECQLCCRGKPGPGKDKSEIEQFKVFRPMLVIGIDILGPLSQSYNNNEYILVVGCYFTKWKEAFALPNHTAATVADKLVQEVFLRFGFPYQIHSDQGPEFQSHLFKEMCTLLGIEKTRTCPYNPKSDGMIERFNRTLITMLSLFVDQNKKDWDDHLPYVMSAYRATQHKSTGASPNLLMLNREIDTPLDVMVGPPPSSKQPECPIKYIEWVRSAMLCAFEYTYQQLGLAATRQKRDYNRGLKPREYEEGNWVWRWYPPTANQKLGLGWVGPYLIIKRLSYLTYRIQKTKEDRPLVVHVDHLKPFAGTKHPENWLLENRETEPLTVDESHPDTPVQIRTRRGRQIKPPVVFSPR